MRARIETLSIQSIALTKLKHRNLEESQKYLEVGAEQVRGGVSALSMVSYAGKRRYDDVETDFLEQAQIDDSEPLNISDIYL